MEFEWDEGKSAANRAKHGIGFERVAECDWLNAIKKRDDRADYGETRIVAYLFLSDRLHTCVYTLRNQRYRIISFRKANRREERDHGK